MCCDQYACFFFNLRNIGPLSSWTLSFKSLILIESIPGFFAFAYLNRELDL
jgi:hypothetical protein